MIQKQLFRVLYLIA